jgi:phytoene dehydrogenase-like protein
MDNKHSIIIIGGGIAGLSTGLAYSKIFDLQENPALIVEKQATVGGCVTTFARKSYKFDTVQIIPDISNLLDFFEIETELISFDKNYAHLFLADTHKNCTQTIPIASNTKAFIAYLVEHYPEDKTAIENFFAYCTAMHNELKYLKTHPNILDLLKILIRCKKIIANSSKTYHEFLRKFNFSHPEVFEILDTFSSFSGLSGNRCAALLTACAMITTLEGSYRPQKGFITFPQLLRKKFESKGGKVLTGVSVEKIIIDKNKVQGVELSDGRIIRSDIVVSTIDTKVCFEKLIGLENLRHASNSYYRKVRKVEMSPSAIAIHIGLDDDIDLHSIGLNCGYSVLSTGSKTHKKAFDLWENGETLISEEEFHFGVIAPSTIVGGKQTLILHVVPIASTKWIKLRELNYEVYISEKNKIADHYIKITEKHLIPDLRKHIQFIDIATPATYARYIGSPTGSNYDMMPVPENFGKNRLKTRTPIKNLYTTKFSHGIWPSMQAGLQVADMISGGKIMNGNASLIKSD